MHRFARIGPARQALAVVMAVICSGFVEAATDTWTGGAGAGSPYWDLPTNWSSGIPGPTSDAALVAFNTEFRPQSGSLAIQSFTGTGTLTISGGALGISLGSTTGGFTMTDGSLVGPGDLTINGTATITYGDHHGTGTTILKSPGTISGGLGFRLDGGRTLRNENALVWTDGQIIFNATVGGSGGPGSGIIHNIGGATFTASGNGASDMYATNQGAGDDGSDAQFINAGTFIKSGSTAGHTTTLAVSFMHSGTATVQSGILNLTRDSTYTGSFTNNAGTVLQFGAGTHALNVALTSLGTFRVSGATVNLNNPTTLNVLQMQDGMLNHAGNAVSVSTLNQNSGSIKGTANLTVNGAATITYGDHQGTGTTILKSPSTISGGLGFRLDGGRTLRNENALTWTDGQIIFNATVGGSGGPGSGIIHNIGGATFTASGNGASDMYATNQGTGDDGSDAQFINAGTFIKSGSTAGHQTAFSIALNNTGTIDVQTGIIKLPDNFTNNGTLKGVGAFATNALNNAGHVAPGASPGTLTLHGNFTQPANGSLDIELVNPYAADKFVVDGSATLGGTLALQCNGCAVQTDEEYVILQSTGTLSGTFANTTVTGFGAGFAHRVVYDYPGGKVKLRILNGGTLPGLTVFKYGSGAGTATSDDSLINCGFICSHPYGSGTMITLTAAVGAGSTFTGWLGACIGTQTTCNVTVGAATTVSATFALSPILPRLDVDANAQSDPLTDGLLILRFMFGLSGPDLTADALGANATRFDPTILKSYLIDIAPYLDADGNGVVDALTDGILIVRYLMNLVDPALSTGAVGPGATRSTGTAISSHLDTLVP